jgi:hypothetical protein
MQGNVQVVLPALVFASLPLIFLFLSLIGQVPPRAEYDDKEVRTHTIQITRCLILVIMMFVSFLFL